MLIRRLCQAGLRLAMVLNEAFPEKWPPDQRRSQPPRQAAVRCIVRSAISLVRPGLLLLRAPALALRTDPRLEDKFESDPEPVDNQAQRVPLAPGQNRQWYLAVQRDLSAKRAPTVRLDLSHDKAPFGRRERAV
jgi:hypothetical protein